MDISPAAPQPAPSHIQGANARHKAKPRGILAKQIMIILIIITIIIIIIVMIIN